MKRAEDFRQAIGTADPSFDGALRRTLTDLQTKEEPRMKRKMSAALALAAAIVLLTVTALAAGRMLPGVLEMLFENEIPEVPQGMVQEVNNLHGETPYAQFSVRELIWDGLGVYVAVDLTPKSEEYLLLPSTLDHDIAPNRPASVLGLADTGNETVAEYAARTGKTMIWTSLYLDSPTTLGITLLSKKDLHPNGDGSWTIVQRGILGRQEEPQMKVGCYTARLTSVDTLPEDMRNTSVDNRWFLGWSPVFEEGNEFRSIPLSLDEVASPLEVRTMAACEEVWKLRSVRLDNVTVTRTPVATYLDVACELMLEGEDFMSSFIFTDADLYRPHLRPFIIGSQVRNEGSIVHWLVCYPLTEEIPDDLWLQLFVSRADSIASRDAGTVHITLK